MTSVVLSTPKIFNPKCIAEVPEFNAIEYLVLQKFEIFSSNFSTVLDEVEINSLLKHF